jgi:hypothetical protein
MAASARSGATTPLNGGGVTAGDVLEAEFAEADAVLGDVGTVTGGGSIAGSTRGCLAGSAEPPRFPNIA